MIDFKKIKMQRYGIIIAIIILSAVFSLLSDVFLTTGNWLNILRQSTIISILAIGVAFVLIGGNIDISIGSLTALICVFLALFQNLGMFVMILLGIFLGLSFGAMCGTLVAGLRINFLVVTFGLLTIYRGLAYILSKARPIAIRTPGYSFIGIGYLLHIPMPVIILFICVSIGAFVLHMTRFGRHIFICGGNPDVARKVGINVRWYTFILFCISGLSCGIAAIVLSSRIGASVPNAALWYELRAIAAAVIGGTSITGGEGSMIGAVLGALLLTILVNGMVLLNISTFYQMIFQGWLLIGAVFLDFLQREGATAIFRME